MSHPRQGLLFGLVFAFAVLVVYFVATGGGPGSSRSSAVETPPCDVEQVFRETAEFASEVGSLRAETTPVRSHDASEIEALRLEASELLQRLETAAAGSKHSVSSDTLALALQEYVRGLDQLAEALDSEDAEAQLEALGRLKLGDSLRRSALDELLDEGQCIYRAS